MDIQKIKKQLPTGAISEISTLSGVNYSTVQRFFSGHQTKESVKIMEKTAEFLKEYKEKRNKAAAELQAVASY